MFQGTPGFLLDVVLEVLLTDLTDRADRLDLVDRTELSPGVFVEVVRQWRLGVDMHLPKSVFVRGKFAANSIIILVSTYCM